MQSRRRTPTRGRNCSWQPRLEAEASDEDTGQERGAGKQFIASYGPLLLLTFIGFFVVPKLVSVLGLPVHEARTASLRGTTAPGHDITEKPIGLPPQSAPSTPAQAPETVDQRATGLGQEQNPEQAAAAIPVEEIRDKLDSLTNQAGAEAGPLRQFLVRRWTEAEPLAAATWAASHFDSESGAPLLKQAVVVWANADLAAAVDWISSLPAGATRPAASIATGYEAARSDPIQALNLAIPLPESEQRDELLVYGMRQYASKEPEAASQWALQIEDPNLRNRLLEAVSTAASVTEPSSAATLVANSMTPGPDQDRAAVTVVQRWAQVAPESAAAWVSIFPPGGVRTDAIENLVGIWSHRDSQAAINWLNSLPAGKSLASASQ